MQADLLTLEDRLAQLVQLSRRLRAENLRLRQELAQALSECRHKQDKIANATERLARLLDGIPEDRV